MKFFSVWVPLESCCGLEKDLVVLAISCLLSHEGSESCSAPAASNSHKGKELARNIMVDILCLKCCQGRHRSIRFFQTGVSSLGDLTGLTSQPELYSPHVESPAWTQHHDRYPPNLDQAIPLKMAWLEDVHCPSYHFFSSPPPPLNYPTNTKGRGGEGRSIRNI